MSGLMQGKRAFVTGVANDRSIAWAIAQQFQAEGAELAFSYPGEAMGKRTVPLVKTLNPAAVLDLDVSSDAQIERGREGGRQGLGLGGRAGPLHRLRAPRGPRRPLHRRHHP